MSTLPHSSPGFSMVVRTLNALLNACLPLLLAAGVSACGLSLAQYGEMTQYGELAQYGQLAQYREMAEADLVQPYLFEAFSAADSEAMRDIGSRWPAPAANPVAIPEPLLFDMVRPLGARRGELEFNVLAIFPFGTPKLARTGDPFGPAPTSPDRGGIEWAPEVEFAPVDNFAVEFELPFEEATLEAYKLGLQWTFGTAFDNRFIHGFQFLTEPTPQWENWNSTFLYLAGIRFDETWSVMLMAGGRGDLEGGARAATVQRLLNASLFANVTEDIVLGVETNFAANMAGDGQLIVLPQAHLELSRSFEVQLGLGAGFTEELTEHSFIMRAIWVP
jgi:hypothetical protein